MREFRLHGSSFENTLYELVLDNGSKHLVTPRQMQIHPGTFVFASLILNLMKQNFYINKILLHFIFFSD